MEGDIGYVHYLDYDDRFGAPVAWSVKCLSLVQVLISGSWN